MAEKKKPKVDMEAMDKITKKVLAFRPSKHQKKKTQQPKKKPPSQ